MLTVSCSLFPDMRILIDARLFGLEHTGIGRYVEELVKGVAATKSPHHFCVLTRPTHHHDIPASPNISVCVADIAHYTLKEQMFLPRLIAREKVDLVHFPHFNVPLLYSGPFVVTIHDLLWHNVLGFRVTTLDPLSYTLKYLGYRAVVRHGISQARKILVPSQWVKRELLKRFSLASKKIVVTYEGVSDIFHHPKETSTVLVPKPYIVYAGSLYPHKNVAIVLAALKELNKSLKPQVTLVLVSSRSIFTSQMMAKAKTLGLQAWVKHLGFLPDEALRQLYHESLAVVQPSTSEGFGLTGLEAMAAGAPVVAAAATSLPEVYGDAALFFNPNEASDLAQKLTLLLKSPEVSERFRLQGKKQAEKYTWKKMVQDTMRVYEEVGQTIKRNSKQETMSNVNA